MRDPHKTLGIRGAGKGEGRGRWRTTSNCRQLVQPAQDYNLAQIWSPPSFGTHRLIPSSPLLSPLSLLELTHSLLFPAFFSLSLSLLCHHTYANTLSMSLPLYYPNSGLLSTFSVGLHPANSVAVLVFLLVLYPALPPFFPKNLHLSLSIPRLSHRS
jgi:hypothetical protein